MNHTPIQRHARALQATEDIRYHAALSRVLNERAMVAPQDSRAPRTDRGHLDPPMRPGDVLRVTCKPGVAEVVSTSAGKAVLRWPWPAPHRGRPSTLAVLLTDGRGGPQRQGMPRELFRYHPDPRITRLSAGDRIRIDIPPTRVHVCDVDDPSQAKVNGPQDGLVELTVLPFGCSDPDRPGPHRYGGMERVLYPWSHTPLTIELLHRPYAMLEGDDEVRDAQGHQWAYIPPLD